MKRPILYCIVVGLVGSVFLAGFLIADLGLFPASYIQRAKSKAARLLFPPEPLTEKTPTVPTHALSLQIERVKVPRDRSGRGGGLTTAGSELLLLNHEGRIFSLQERTFVESRLELPSNGYREYEKAAETDYPDLSHDIRKFRYNDIQYVPGAPAQLLVSYTHWRPDEECYANSVSRLALPENFSALTSRALEEDWDLIYSTSPCLPLKEVGRALEGHMAGGRLALTARGTVLLGSGDYHWDGVRGPEAIAQNEEFEYGKVIEIEINSGNHRILSTGHRNISGVAVGSNGQIWTVEHGPRGGDELNHVREGGDYGWPSATFGTLYNGLAWPLGDDWARHESGLLPTYAWVPSIGISSIEQVNDFHPAWDHDLLIGSLKQQTLFRLRLEDEKVVFVEPIPIGDRIRYVHQHDEETIALLTDSRAVLILTIDETPMVWNIIEAELAKLEGTPSRQKRARAAVEQCAECHAFEPGKNQGAPNLVSVLGMEIASTTYTGYSTALRSISGSWTEKRLATFLADPQSFAPGTTMPNPGLKEETIDDLVSVMGALNDG